MDSWTSWLGDGGRELLEPALALWLPRQRWFGAKARTIDSVRVLRWAEMALETSGVPALLLHAAVHYSDGDGDVYQIPLALSTGRDAERLAEVAPEAVLVQQEAAQGFAVVHDGIVRGDVREALLALMVRNAALPLHAACDEALDAGRIEARTCAALAATTQDASRVGTDEQSNTSIVYGDKLILKLFRRLEPGVNPDVEMGRFLSATVQFRHVAPLLGAMAMIAPDGERTTLAMLQGFVPNEGDGWRWFLAQTGAFFAAADEAEIDATDAWPERVRAAAEPALQAAALLGQRTAELHLALSGPTEDKAFTAEAVTQAHLQEDARRIEMPLTATCDLLQAKLAGLSEEISDGVNTLLARRGALAAKIDSLAALPAAGQRIRIHGDLHLGQTLRTQEGADGDFILIDFEGEPARSLAERRSKQLPLKDVAGMVRSFAYAAFAGLDAFLKTRNAPGEGTKRLTAWAARWEKAATAEFLTRYGQTVAANRALLPPAAQAEAQLRAYVLEKTLYELAYELNHRPAWLHIPLSGILQM